MATSTGGALVVEEEAVGGAVLVDEVVVEEVVVGGAVVAASVAGTEAVRTSEVVLVVPRSRITGTSDPPPQPEDSSNARSTLVRRARIAPV